MEQGGSSWFAGRIISRLIAFHVQLSEAHHHVNNSERRKRVLNSLNQPLTAKQIARKTGLPFDSCRDAVCELAGVGLLRCLNPEANKSRLYWMTRPGMACQRRVRAADGLAPYRYDFPSVNWSLYGWVCFRHRSAIIKALRQPLQPSAIKRKARSQDPTLRMSANNVRDVIREFVKRGIVKPLKVGGEFYVRYTLTKRGKELQELLRRAQEVAWA